MTAPNGERGLSQNDIAPLHYGSLCTGIGGLDLAVEAHFGAVAAWHSEVEPAPCMVLDRHWPDVPNLGDLTALDWTALPAVDVLTAGYPCQPFSHAGKRKGKNDVRHLWPHIAEAVRSLRPRWVVLENVAGHLSLGFGQVLGDLAEAGFDAEWCLLRASDVGACHQRARLFLVATDPNRVAGAPTFTGGGRPGPMGEQGSEPGVERLRGVAWGDYAPAIARWERTLGRPVPDPTDDGRLSPRFVEWMMGYPLGWVDGLTRSQALKALGNAVVPHQGLAALRELVPTAVLNGAAA